MENMSFFWFSFSKEAENQGCVNIEADTEEAAMEKAKSLGIVPEYDDVAAFRMGEPVIPVDVLVPPEEMRKRQYESERWMK